MEWVKVTSSPTWSDCDCVTAAHSCIAFAEVVAPVARTCCLLTSQRVRWGTRTPIRGRWWSKVATCCLVLQRTFRWIGSLFGFCCFHGRTCRCVRSQTDPDFEPLAHNLMTSERSIWRGCVLAWKLDSNFNKSTYHAVSSSELEIESI